MAIPRMRSDNTAVFIIDMHDVVLRAMPNAGGITRKCAGMLEIAGAMNLPSIITEHWVSRFGRTVDAVLEAAPEDCRIIEKVYFSAHSEEVQAALRSFNRPNIIVGGIEAHICVTQTALDLLEAGYHVFLLEDAIGSGEAATVEPAVRRLERYGAIPTTVVQAAYELMESPNHDAFKPVLNVVKSVLASAEG
jgi:nicotinamidase-related amidase